MNTDKHRSGKHQSRYIGVFNFRLTSVSICVYLWMILLTSCGSKTPDLRALIPADSLVYLESNDLGAVMKAITDRPAFREAAKTVPDFSALNGVKLAVAVTGFETKEQPVTDENSVLSFQPRFVAILDTNAWNFQALAFTEHKLGEFINQVYGGEVLLETSDKHDGRYFVWTANDGRKAFALVQGSIVYFGNDETVIEKSLAVKRGEADAISKNPKITNGDRLAFGYVSPDGVAQIANIIGIKYASEASDEPEVQSAVSGLLPQLLRNSLREVSWTATKSDDGIVDSYSISLDPETASVFKETLVSSGRPHSGDVRLDLDSASSVTRYDLRDPRLAWRSIVLAAGKSTNSTGRMLINALSDGIFEPYGIDDAEKFLSSVESEIFTIRLDEGGQNVVLSATARDFPVFEQSVAKELNVSSSEGKTLSDQFVRRSSDGELMLNVESEHILLGDAESVAKVHNGLAETSHPTKHPFASRMFASNAIAASIGLDTSSARKIASIISDSETESVINSYYFTETSFNGNKFERSTVSDFGFIGWIITQFGKEE